MFNAAAMGPSFPSDSTLYCPPGSVVAISRGRARAGSFHPLPSAPCDRSRSRLPALIRGNSTTGSRSARPPSRRPIWAATRLRPLGRWESDLSNRTGAHQLGREVPRHGALASMGSVADCFDGPWPRASSRPSSASCSTSSRVAGSPHHEAEAGGPRLIAETVPLPPKPQWTGTLPSGARKRRRVSHLFVLGNGVV